MDRVPDHHIRAIVDMGFEYKRAGDDAKARFLEGRQRDCYSAAERLVFHGTDADHLESIFDYGFDPAHRSRNKKHQRFGPREYFSTDHASAAAWGRERYRGKHIVVIVAVVLEDSAEDHTGRYKGRMEDITTVDNQDDATFVHPIGFKFYDSRASAPPAAAQTYHHAAARDYSSDDDSDGVDNDGRCRHCPKQAHSRCAFNCCGACCRCTAHASHGTAGECNNCNSQAKKGCANGQCGACCRNSGPCDVHDSHTAAPGYGNYTPDAGECNNCNSQAKTGCANGMCGACCRNSRPCDVHDNPRGRRR